MDRLSWREEKKNTIRIVVGEAVLPHRGLRQSAGVYSTLLSAGIRFVMTPLVSTAAVSMSTLLEKSASALLKCDALEDTFDDFLRE